MRTLIVWTLLGAAIHLAAVDARAEDPPPAAADASSEASPAATTEAVPVEAAKPEAKAFVPPDGWRPKKRGKFTVYCRKEIPQGTHIPKETCYDEEGIEAMLAAQAEDRERVDQMRRVCSSQATCGSN